MRATVCTAALGAALLGLAGCASAVSGHGRVGAHEVSCPRSAATDRDLHVDQTGADPRRQFRFTATTATRQDATFTLDLEVDSAGRELAVPTTQMPVQITVPSSCSAGLVYRAVYQRPHVDPDAANASALQEQYDKIAGMTLTAAVDRAGNTVDSQLTHLPDFGAQTQNLLSSIQNFDIATVGFPDRPIGVGATWVAHRQVVSGPVHLDLTAHFELTKWDGSKATVDSTITESAQPYSQTIQGHKITVAKLTGSGRGELAVSPDTLLPVGSLDVSSAAHVSADDGSSATTTTRLKMKVD